MAQTLGALANGSLIVDLATTYNGAPIVWRKIDTNHTGYPANSVTLITDRIISVKAFDAKEPTNANATRASAGNNRYRSSNLRQWLNSSAAGGLWWKAQNPNDGTANTNNADTAPSAANVNNSSNPYDTEYGFLKNISLPFKAAVMPTTLTVAKNTVTDGGGSETVTDSFFLASTTEVGFGNQNNIAEGNPIAYFSSNIARQAYPTPEAVSQSAAVSSLATTTCFPWMLRTANGGTSSTVLTANGIGSQANASAFDYNYNGLRPLCNLPSATLVSDGQSAGASVGQTIGVYTIWWYPPTISGTDSALGAKSTAFSQAYTVTAGAAGDSLTITETIDNTMHRIFTAASGIAQTFNLDTATFVKIANGNHTLTITATNQRGESATRNFTFTKNETQINFTLAAPLPANTRPERITLRLMRLVPTGATLQIWACNNACDASPTWEDITTNLLHGESYTFNNQTKTSLYWGINIRVNVNRGSTSGDCYINSISGGFD